MNKNFHENLTKYLQTHDLHEANRVVMEELGNILLKDRENFITLLKYADIPVNTEPSDSELIDSFINNIDSNRKLLIGAAFLANQHNKQMGFDGEEKVSDEGVKAAHQTMFSYFEASQHEEDVDPEYSNAIGIGVATKAAGFIAKKATKGRDDRKKAGNNLAEMAAKKEAAKQQLIATVLAQRKLQQEIAQKALEQKQKQKKTTIIVAASIGGLLLLIGGIYLIKTKK